MPTKHRKINYIARLKRGNRSASTQRDMETMAADYFSDVLGKASMRPHAINLHALPLPQVDLAELDLPFSEREVWEAIRTLPVDRAPGPDGFTTLFYQSCRATIKVDILDAIDQCFRLDGSSMHLLNQAFLVLLQKKDSAIDLADFRPISLVHNFPKLLAKLLANRLNPPPAAQPTKAHSSRGARSKTTSSWSNRQSNCCIERNCPLCSSSSICPRPSTLWPGPFSWKFFDIGVLATSGPI